MAALVVLQARLSSARLPAKAMLAVGGRPMVALAGLRAANRGMPVTVATSDEPDDDVVAAAAAQVGLAVVRGPLDDPLARFAAAASPCADDDVVVRLTADNVVPDGSLVESLAAEVSAVRPYVRVGGDDRTVPYGLAGEAFLVRTLRAAHAAAVSEHDREHVTPWIRRRHGDALLEVRDVPLSWGRLRCTVDTFDDYVRVARLFEAVDDPVRVPWRRLCELLAADPGPDVDAGADVASDANVLGQTRLVLGTAQLGMPYGAANEIGVPSDSGAAAILRSAAAAGISHVDTARAYGSSEERIGRAATRRGIGSLRVVTKVEPLDALPAGADPAWGRAAVRASVATSLHQLAPAPVDAVLVHRARDWSRPGVRDALVALRDEGAARVVGASLSAPDELVDLLADPEVGYVQLPSNPLDRRWVAPPVVDALAARPDVVVACRSVFLQGLLTAGTAARWPANAGVDPITVMATIDALVHDLDRVSRADLCVAAVLGQPSVTSVVVGAETADQVADLAALARRRPLDPSELAVVHERLPAAPVALLDPSRWLAA